MQKIIESSESKHPNKELILFVKQIQSINSEEVFELFEEKHVKEKNWVANLNDVFINPNGWRNNY